MDLIFLGTGAAWGPPELNCHCMIKTRPLGNREVQLVYTSDLEELPEPHPDLIHPDYLIIQSFWLHEPIENRPHHMSFQRALKFIERWKPKLETFLVHMGDGETAPPNERAL
ncbi:MAG: hypothetical protein PVI20_18785 [Desulfobacteraceae bacterium]|jgi:phosphoribosyl 1,2-cyclic phosphate phosphodiesterase